MPSPRKAQEVATTMEAVALYETTAGLLGALYGEIQELSKKRADATLNAQKVKMINRLLSDLRKILQDEPNLKYLDLVDDVDLPQYSDVVLILSQYVSAMKAFRDKYYRYDNGTHHWFTVS